MGREGDSLISPFPVQYYMGTEGGALSCLHSYKLYLVQCTRYVVGAVEGWAPEVAARGNTR